MAYLLQGRYARAIRILAQARRLGQPRPHEFAAACRGRAGELYRAGMRAAASRLLLGALRETPDDALTWSNLGALYGSLGKVRAGISCMRRAVLLSPENLGFRSNLAVIANYRADWSPERIRDWHLELFGDLRPPADDHENSPSLDRPLRIGYFSADFRFRPPAFFLPSLLRHHDRNCFVIFCYSNTQYQDEYTMQMRGESDYWRDILGLDDNEAVAVIREDRIDILVDRTGHFERGRPGLFARRPAPVQVGLPGYPATTGVPGIDYRLTDSYADPLGETEHLHSEMLVRLPECFACYSPATRSPEVGPLPAHRNGYVTFGCFQKRDKINAGDLRAWARILNAVPQSRLVFHHLFSGVQDAPAEFRRPVDRYLKRLGVPTDRVQWEGCRPHYEHLEAIGRVDLALDTYPYNGMTTTCECLWMGVPVVSRRGIAHACRVGFSYLSNVGLADWTAGSEEAYVQLAVERACDIDALASTRASLRSAMEGSPLMDAVRYTRAVEEAYRWMWSQWCMSRSGRE